MEGRGIKLHSRDFVICLELVGTRCVLGSYYLLCGSGSESTI